MVRGALRTDVTVWLIIGGVGYLVAAGFGWALCRIAALSDRDRPQPDERG